MSKVYYKLVNSDLASFNMRPDNYKKKIFLAEGSAIQYVVGEWVNPTIGGSKIFIFDTLENCKSFLSKMTRDTQAGTRIFECEAKGVTNEFIFYNGGILNHIPSRFLTLCKLRKQKKKWKHLADYVPWDPQPPQGTLFASSIKLTKEITK